MPRTIYLGEPHVSHMHHAARYNVTGGEQKKGADGKGVDELRLGDA